MSMPSDPCEAYERGYFVATQRAISRQALGLPLDRSANDDELLSPAQVSQGMTLDWTIRSSGQIRCARRD